VGVSTTETRAVAGRQPVGGGAVTSSTVAG
jgi:hypothetical protein